MAVLVAVDLDGIVAQLRELLGTLDSLLKEPLPPHAAATGSAARKQVAHLIEDSLDLIEVGEAFKEAGAERIPLSQVQAELRQP
jgi:hypothetical protein